MPTWGAILAELQDAQAQSGQPAAISPFDSVRRKYLAQLAGATGRAVILYATKWTQPPHVAPDLTSITAEDIQGFMEVTHGLEAEGLDLILHSPGGSAEAAESLVSYTRSKFSNVRVFVPHAAMSAATMLACSADRIVMGKHSFLGPIDPQFILQTELGANSVPAHAIEEQFAQAKREIQVDPALLPAWLPLLRQYGPALIVQCRLARELSESLVEDWLNRYMFGQHHVQPGLPKPGTTIAKTLADHGSFKSHSRFINRDQAKALGLVIDDLEQDQTLQDAVLSVFHATSHTFNGTPCVKIIENHIGKAFIKVPPMPQIVFAPHQQGLVPIPFPVSPLPPPGPPQTRN